MKMKNILSLHSTFTVHQRKFYWERQADSSWRLRKFDAVQCYDGFVIFTSQCVLGHVVLPHDTITAICLRYNLSVSDLKRFNSLSESKIRETKTLRIPVQAGLPILYQQETDEVLLQRFQNATQETAATSKYYMQENEWDLERALLAWDGSSAVPAASPKLAFVDFGINKIHSAAMIRLLLTAEDVASILDKIEITGNDAIQSVKNGFDGEVPSFPSMQQVDGEQIITDDINYYARETPIVEAAVNNADANGEVKKLARTEAENIKKDVERGCLPQSLFALNAASPFNFSASNRKNPAETAEYCGASLNKEFKDMFENNGNIAGIASVSDSPVTEPQQQEQQQALSQSLSALLDSVESAGGLLMSTMGRVEKSLEKSLLGSSSARVGRRIVVPLRPAAGAAGEGDDDDLGPKLQLSTMMQHEQRLAGGVLTTRTRQLARRKDREANSTRTDTSGAGIRTGIGAGRNSDSFLSGANVVTPALCVVGNRMSVQFGDQQECYTVERWMDDARRDPSSVWFDESLVQGPEDGGQLVLSALLDSVSDSVESAGGLLFKSLESTLEGGLSPEGRPSGGPSGGPVETAEEAVPSERPRSRSREI